MKRCIYLCVVLLMLIVSACVEESYIDNDALGEVQTVNVIGPDTIDFDSISDDNQTKGTGVIYESNKLTFSWVLGDTLGIFPNKGNQVEFPISSSDGTAKASFDGGGWALRNNASYAAYYPFNVWNYHRDNETIVLDYTGQVQEGNGNFDHLSAYDFLASNMTTPVNNSVTFDMVRQGSILFIDIVVPEPGTINLLKVSCDEAIFTEKAALDISGESPIISPVKMTDLITLNFENTVTSNANETVRAYMAVQPVDFSDKKVKATLCTENGNYSAVVTPRVINKGKAAFLRFPNNFTPIIDFADAEVKRICVENWDTDEDGELSYVEAASITNIGHVFKGTKITSFEELKYFKGLTYIYSGAFEDCESLSCITLPESVTIIGEYTFYNCESLSSIELPESVSVIGRAAFNECSSLSNIIIPKSVSVIEPYTFLNCKSLTTIRIPENVATIGEKAFCGCIKLSSINIPESVKSIGDYVFVNCSNLTNIRLPQSLTNIGKGAFRLCSKLGNITIPKLVTTISDELFFNCGALGYVNIEGDVTDIGMGAFYQCINLISITIPESVNNIGDCAFWDCTVLNNINLPQSLKTLCDGTFGRCHNLKNISLPESLSDIGGQAFFECVSLENIDIPESVTKIGNEAFWKCNSFTKITIPKSVNSIGSFAFYTDSNLSLYIECSIPPTLGGELCSQDSKIYVQNEYIDTYKSSWTAYADIIYGIEVDGSVLGPEPDTAD